MNTGDKQDQFDYHVWVLFGMKNFYIRCWSLMRDCI